MSRRMVCLVGLVALVALCSAWQVGATDPFANGSNVKPANGPPSITRFAGLPMNVIGVPEQLSGSYLVETTQGSGSLSPPPIALEPRLGTGSQLLTGLLAQGKMDLTHQLDPKATALIAQLTEGMGKLSQLNPKVSITPTLPPEISQSLSQTSDRLNQLAWLASIVLSIFGIDKAGRWVPLVVAGLRSAFAAKSQAPFLVNLPPELLSLISPALAAKAAEPSSTAKPAS